MIPLRFIGATVLLAGTPGGATVYLGGSVEVHAGYGDNPFLNSNQTGGSALFGATLSAALTSRGSTSSTTLSGSAGVEQNAKKYGRSENVIVQLLHTQALSERVSVNGGLGYQNTVNPQQLGGLATSYYNQAAAIAAANTAAGTTTVVDPGVGAVDLLPAVGFTAGNLDPLTLGQRSERLFGSVGASWQASARDQISVGGNVGRTTYKSFQGDYKTYGADLNYLRTIDGRTKVGVDLASTSSTSDFFPTATSYTASLVLQRQFNTRWSLDGRVGAIIPDGGVANGSSASLSFGLNLCGRYPRAVLCFSSSRRAAPTGLGGLRNDLQAGVSLVYDLDERSQVSGSVDVDRSGAGSSGTFGKQTYYQANAGYNRTLGPRTSIGGSVRYQRRNFSGALGSNDSYAVTINVTRRFGRNG